MNLANLELQIETAWCDLSPMPCELFLREVGDGLAFELTKEPQGRFRRIDEFDNAVRLDVFRKRVFDTLHAMRPA